MRNLLKKMMIGSIVTLFVTSTANAFQNGSFELDEQTGEMTGGYLHWNLKEIPEAPVDEPGTPPPPPTSEPAPPTTDPTASVPPPPTMDPSTLLAAPTMDPSTMMTSTPELPTEGPATTNSVATWGTWGVVQDLSMIALAQEVYDRCDKVNVKQTDGDSLPKTFKATDGRYVAVQLQNGTQAHRAYQDFTLPADAVAIKWDMSYKSNSIFIDNYGELNEPDDQFGHYIALNIRDQMDNILAKIYQTEQGAAQEVAEMTTFTSSDISQFAGQNVRVDIIVKNGNGKLATAIDNFRVEVAPPEPPTDTTRPAGWDNPNGKKKGWGDGNLPPGLDKESKQSRKDAKKAAKQAKKEEKRQAKLDKLKERLAKLFDKLMKWLDKLMA